MATKSISKAFSTSVSQTRDSVQLSLVISGLTIATMAGINGPACQRVFSDKSANERDRLDAMISLLVALRDGE